jgi:hypothetical protein
MDEKVLGGCHLGSQGDRGHPVSVPRKYFRNVRTRISKNRSGSRFDPLLFRCSLQSQLRSCRLGSSGTRSLEQREILATRL